MLTACWTLTRGGTLTATGLLPWSLTEKAPCRSMESMHSLDCMDSMQSMASLECMEVIVLTWNRMRN